MTQSVEYQRRASSTARWVGGMTASLLAVGAGWLVLQAGVPEPLRLSHPMVICVIMIFAIQWIAFLPAWWYQTERFYDLLGGSTFVIVLYAAFIQTYSIDTRSLVIVCCVTIWGARLAIFLTQRIKEAGEDRRFRSIRPYFPTFFMTWTLQGLWVALTAGAALATITTKPNMPTDALFWIGLALWVAGLAMEVSADRQKSNFRADPANANKFITTGLWAWCRHPNYFGEILCWLGIAVMCITSLMGWQLLLVLLSPVWVFLQLTVISGVRMLSNRAQKQWGDDPEYHAYVKRTPMLIPLPPFGQNSS